MDILVFRRCFLNMLHQDWSFGVIRRAATREKVKKLLAEWAKFAGPLATADVIPFKAA